MKIPVILTAASGSPAARASYRILENHILNSLPDGQATQYEIYWGYSRRVINRERAKRDSSSLPGMADIARQLVTKGYHQAILQSLQLMIGHEFHQLRRESGHNPELTCHPGMPLLTNPTDFQDFMAVLADIAAPYPDHALLLIGHGTRHASWPIYLGLEQVMRQHFGRRAYVGVVEHFPNSEDMEQRIARDGHRRVLLIPFFLLKGLHLQRDVVGDTASSWKRRLVEAGFEMAIACEEGLAVLPAVARIYARHIIDAASRIA